MKQVLSYLLVLCSLFSFSQEAEFTSEDISINQHVDGTLLTPSNINSAPLVIIIADNGPTDRNGNQNFQQNSALKKLAESLSNQKIVTFRYDKRIVKQIRKGRVDPNISFDDFVNDAKAVIDYFKAQNSYSKIIVIGHGQGSLVGMLAASDNIDQFISLAGSGKSIDKVIIDQIEQMDPALVESTTQAFDKLREGHLVNDYPQALGSIFSPDVQPFMMSWMAYHPQKLIKNLDIPVFIINGTKDLQVPIEEAQLLKDANPKANFKLIDNMNHVLYIIEGNELENSKSYNESFRSISNELVATIVAIISD